MDGRIFLHGKKKEQNKTVKKTKERAKFYTKKKKEAPTRFSNRIFNICYN
jgi:hypothetical protein